MKSVQKENSRINKRQTRTKSSNKENDSKFNNLTFEQIKEKTKGSTFTKQYEIVKLIQKGSFGFCFECLEKSNNRPVAVKIMSRENFVENELEALKDCKHEKYVVELLEHLQDNEFHYLVFELLKTDLFERIEDKLSENEARELFRQLSHAVNHIHSKGYVHCDLKKENIVLAGENLGSAKIIDFGSTCKVNATPDVVEFTRGYDAPECHKNDKVTKSRDVWALGVLLYEFLTGLFPFAPEKRFKVIKSTEEWKLLSKNARNLITSLLETNRGKRITLPAVLKHPWLKV